MKISSEELCLMKKVAENNLREYVWPVDFMGLYDYCVSLLMHRMQKDKKFFKGLQAQQKQSLEQGKSWIDWYTENVL